jgi:RNA polymerase sigma-70 factor (ECF subfamily)
MAGIERVAAFLARVAELPGLMATTAWFNGMPGACFDLDGEATAVSMVIEDGRITRIYAIRNPQKLGRLKVVAELRR